MGTQRKGKPMRKTFWERSALLYDFAMRKHDDEDKEVALCIARFLSPNCTLLEAACGTGRFSCALAPGVKHVSCCDYAKNMVSQTRKKAGMLGLENMDFSVQDITSLDFPENHFDVSIAANVLHLLPNPDRAVFELLRVTKPGGLLIFPNFVNAGSAPSGKRFLAFLSLFGFRPQNEWTEVQFLGFLRERGLEILEHHLFPSEEPLCVAITRML